MHDPTTPARSPVPMTNSKAIASMVLGITALFVPIPFVLGITAIILGNAARREMAARPGQEGDGFATAGIVLGWVDIAFSLILSLILMLFLFGVVLAGTSFG